MSLHLKQLQSVVHKYPNIIEIWKANAEYEIRTVKNILFSCIKVFTLMSLAFLLIFLIDAAQDKTQSFGIAATLLLLLLGMYYVVKLLRTPIDEVMTTGIELTDDPKKKGIEQITDI